MLKISPQISLVRLAGAFHRKHEPPLTPCPRTSQETVSKTLCLYDSTPSAAFACQKSVNYRFISLLSTFNNFFLQKRNVIFDRLSHYLEKRQLTFGKQFDFHSYHSIDHAMLSIIHKINDR